MKPTKLEYEINHYDDSGVQYAIRYDGNATNEEIEIESVDKIKFPASKIEWLIDCLRDITYELPSDEDD